MIKLSFTDHVYQLNACQQAPGLPERFESRHQSRPSFDVPVILLLKVVQIFVLPDSDASFI
ncbi:hypothetical protein ACO03_21305 (plasmid) [Pantoea ananatis]|nr:hypothetical protein ACO03_21305 [Pantoea ananatis]